MRHRADAGFWEVYDALPEAIREQADKAFELMKKDRPSSSIGAIEEGRYEVVRKRKQEVPCSRH